MITFKKNQQKNYMLDTKHTDENNFLALKQLGMTTDGAKTILPLIRSTHFNVIDRGETRYLETVFHLDQCCVCTLFFDKYMDSE